MRTFYGYSRLIDGILIVSYGVSSVAAIVAILFLFLALARPQSVVVLDGKGEARLIESAELPPINTEAVESFVLQFAKYFAVGDVDLSERNRTKALEMMTIPLERYERSPPREELAVRRQVFLESKNAKGRLIDSLVECRQARELIWACDIQGSIEYVFGSPQRTSRVQRELRLHAIVEQLRVTKRSPYGLLINNFDLFDSEVTSK